MTSKKKKYSTAAEYTAHANLDTVIDGPGLCSYFSIEIKPRGEYIIWVQKSISFPGTHLASSKEVIIAALNVKIN